MFEPVPLPAPVPVLPPLTLPAWSLDLTLHCSDSIFTSVTLNVPFDKASPPEELAVGEALGFALLSQVPFRETSWPT